MNFTLGEEIRKDGIINMSRAWDKEKEKKGNYVGNLTGKSQEQRLQDNRTRVSFVTLTSLYSHFCRNSRKPP